MTEQETATSVSSSKTTGTLRGLKDLEGFKITATDGDIGRVHDFFFDDRSWTVRYLVADTGHWLPGRKVLLPAPMLIGPDPHQRSFAVSITREQVKTSPDVDTDKPVSRLREIELNTHYDWPFHWGGVDGWIGPGPPVPPIEPPPPSGQEDTGNIHLRSVREMTGYKVEAVDGHAGHVDDFVANDRTWAIVRLVIITGKRPPRRRVGVSPNLLAGPISWSEKTVKFKVTQEDLKAMEPWVSSGTAVASS